MRGIQSTVPVTSRVAYKILSAGFNSIVWPTIQQPTLSINSSIFDFGKLAYNRKKYYILMIIRVDI